VFSDSPTDPSEAMECRFCNSTSTAPKIRWTSSRESPRTITSFDRDEEDEISISVAGGWSEYNIAFTWLAEVEALHVACAFDLKVPAAPS
jgi:Putative bacterial sensory transduction regulator